MGISYSDDIYNLDDIIHYHISKYRNSGYDREELYQIAYLGYLQARANYNPDKGKMTLLYVSKYIKGSLYHTIKKENKFKHTELGFLETESGEILGIEPEVMCSAERDRDLATKNRMLKHVDKIKSIIHLLPIEESEIIYEYYLAPKTKSLLEIAKTKGVTKQRIHQIKAQGIENIKNILGIKYLNLGM